MEDYRRLWVVEKEREKKCDECVDDKAVLIEGFIKWLVVKYNNKCKQQNDFLFSLSKICIFLFHPLNTKFVSIHPNKLQTFRLNRKITNLLSVWYTQMRSPFDIPCLKPYKFMISRLGWSVIPHKACALLKGLRQICNFRTAFLLFI